MTAEPPPPPKPKRQIFPRGERTSLLMQMRRLASDIVEGLTGKTPAQWESDGGRITPKWQMAARFDASSEGVLISEAMEVYRATQYVDGSYMPGDMEMAPRRFKPREYSSNEELRLMEAVVARMAEAVAACREELKDFAREVTQGSRLAKPLKACRMEMRDVAQKVHEIGKLMETMHAVTNFRDSNAEGGKVSR